MAALLDMNPENADQLRKLAIIPAYNEEGMVAQVVRGIRRHAPEFDIVVVDDGSTDGTFAEASGEGVTVIRHPFNLGIGGAMQSGFKYALASGYDVAAQVDGDGQHKPAYLNDMLQALRTGGKADMVCGSRFRENPGYKVPIGRRVGNLIFSVILSVMVRRRITDPTSGFRMTNRRGIELFARDYPHDYPEVEAILMLHAHRLRLHEVPVRMNARGFGRSSIDYPRSAYYMAKVLLALFIGLFRKRPVPGDRPPDRPEGEPVAPAASTSAATEETRGAAVGR
jgi:glycosyltransferase involved in cell wall biosynthesis